MTTILLIAKGFDRNGKTTKDAILEINIEFQSIKIQEVDPMNLVALMANMNPDQSFWDKMGSYLRSSHDFKNFEEFFSYHVRLIKQIWQEQLKFDFLEKSCLKEGVEMNTSRDDGTYTIWFEVNTLDLNPEKRKVKYTSL